MPFQRPNLGELRVRIADDLMDKLPGSNARLRVNNLRAFSEVEAGTTHLLYGFIQWAFRQLFPDTAEAEYLDRWASIWGVSRIPAAAARGPAAWEAAPGAVVQAGALVQIVGAENVRYRVVQGVSEQNGRVVLDLEAVTYGARGDAGPGTPVSFMTTAPGVAVQGEVQEPGLAGGADEQSDDALLQAVLYRIQLPPHGGAAFDYVRWALEVPGVTRVWCNPLEAGAGTVVVRFMMDQVRAPTGIPTPADVALVRQHIDPLRPVTAKVTVAAPIPVTVNVQIRGLQPDAPSIRANIETSLRSMLLSEAEPGHTIFLSQWFTAIGMTPEVHAFTLDQPGTDTVVGPSQIPILGTVTYS